MAYKYLWAALLVFMAQPPTVSEILREPLSPSCMFMISTATLFIFSVCAVF